jgi:exopolysaccharide biosynthesis polyprenyl glycosylphosphotransferase
VTLATDDASELQLTASALEESELYAGVSARTRTLLERRRGHPLAPRRGWLVRRALAAADCLGFMVAFTMSLVLFGGSGVSDHVNDVAEVAVFACTLPLWIVAANMYGLYHSDEERTDHSTADDLIGVLHLVTIGSWLFFAFTTLINVVHPTVPRLLTFWLASIVLVTSFRAVARALCRRSLAYLQNTVIVGAGEVGQLVARKIVNHHEYGLNFVGFVDANPKEVSRNLLDTTLLGSPEQLPEIVQALDIERVIIAFSSDSHEDMLDLIRSLSAYDVQIDIVPRLFEVLSTNVGIHTAEGIPLIGLTPLRLSRSALLLKRVLDIALAMGALLVVAPLLAVAAIAIKLDSPGPVFFRQRRRGCGDQIFTIFKFRTMVVDAEEQKDSLRDRSKHAQGDARMFKIEDDPRVTRVGRVLRRYSLDELPQLVNVLRGEMSIVGPRPLILEEDQHVVDWRRRRVRLKPGITGLWQVLGRDEIPFEEMVKLDYLYVNSWSILTDVKLILRTIPILFRPHFA